MAEEALLVQHRAIRWEQAVVNAAEALVTQDVRPHAAEMRKVVRAVCLA